MIERPVKQQVNEALGRKAAVASVGPRQVGKTTLANEFAGERDADAQGTIRRGSPPLFNFVRAGSLRAGHARPLQNSPYPTVRFDMTSGIPFLGFGDKRTTYSGNLPSG